MAKNEKKFGWVGRETLWPKASCYGRDLADAHTDSSTGTRPPVLELTIPAAPPALAPALTCFWPSNIQVVALS